MLKENQVIKRESRQKVNNKSKGLESNKSLDGSIKIIREYVIRIILIE